MVHYTTFICRAQGVQRYAQGFQTHGSRVGWMQCQAALDGGGNTFFVRVSSLRSFAFAGGLESEFQVMALKAVKLTTGQYALKHRHMPLITHLPERKLRGTAHAVGGVDEATEYCFKGAGIAECTQRLHARVIDYSSSHKG
jgi:hypothetical protein